MALAENLSATNRATAGGDRCDAPNPSGREASPPREQIANDYCHRLDGFGTAHRPPFIRSSAAGAKRRTDTRGSPDPERLLTADEGLRRAPIPHPLFQPTHRSQEYKWLQLRFSPPA